MMRPSSSLTFLFALATAGSGCVIRSLDDGELTCPCAPRFRCVDDRCVPGDGEERDAARADVGSMDAGPVIASDTGLDAFVADDVPFVSPDVFVAPTDGGPGPTTELRSYDISSCQGGQVQSFGLAFAARMAATSPVVVTQVEFALEGTNEPGCDSRIALDAYIWVAAATRPPNVVPVDSIVRSIDSSGDGLLRPISIALPRLSVAAGEAVFVAVGSGQVMCLVACTPAAPLAGAAFVSHAGPPWDWDDITVGARVLDGGSYRANYSFRAILE